ncbi:hypothetical protein, partial [Vibrio harveyi]|uniref:hypothetical protein n=1 Tax=Vibrio harveyi TaxID=669 RepID=UPI001A7E7E49
KTKNSLLWGNVFINTSAMTIQNDNFYRSGGGCGISTVYSLKDSNLSISRLNANTNCETGDKPISQWQSFTKEQYNNWPSLLDE